MAASLARPTDLKSPVVTLPPRLQPLAYATYVT
jgi:hypothetical protein